MSLALGKYAVETATSLLGSIIDDYRIDKDIKNFYENRTLLNARHVGLFALKIFAESYAFYSLGIVNVLPPLIFAHAVVKPACKGDFKSLSENFPSGQAVKHLSLGIVAGGVFCCLNRYIGSAFKRSMESRGVSLPGQDIGIAIKGFGFGGIYWSFFAAIVAPLFEEIAFRGSLLDHALSKGNSQPQQGENTRFGKCFRTMKAIIATSVIFALMHGSLSQRWSNVYAIGICSLMGSVFGLLKVTTGNLWAPVAAHAINNIMAVALLRRPDIIHSLEGRTMEMLWRNKGALLLLL